MTPRIPNGRHRQMLPRQRSTASGHDAPMLALSSTLIKARAIVLKLDSAVHGARLDDECALHVEAIMARLDIISNALAAHAVEHDEDGV